MNGKKVVASVVTMMMVGTMLCRPVKVNAEYNIGTFTNPDATSLNSVLDYGVFTKNFKWIGDMEANVATRMFESNSNTGVSENTFWATDGAEMIANYYEKIHDLASWKGNRPNSATNSVLILGNGITVDPGAGSIKLTETDTGTLKNSNTFSIANLGANKVYNVNEVSYKIDFDAAFAAMATYSKAQYEKSDTTGVQVVEKKSGSEITELDVICPDGDNVVNLDYAEYLSASKNPNLQLKISGMNGSTNYSLIINVTNLPTDGTGVTFDKTILVDGSNAIYGDESTRVLFNLGPGYSGTAEFKKTDIGNVLIPNGNIMSDQTHNGAYYAQSVENSSGEVHQSRFRTIGKSTKPKTGSLKVTKTVSGSEGDKAKEFPFTVTLDDKTVNGTYAGMTFANGVATFTLKDGESVQADKLPYTNYVVSESGNDGYVVTKTGDTGTINSALSTAAFTNTKGDTDGPSYGKLTILKNGADGPKLAGAHYKIFKEVSSARMYYIAPTVAGTAATWTSDISAATMLETNTEGEAFASGFEAGDYDILEVYPAPRGYQVDSTPIPFTITKEEAETESSVSVSTHQVDELITPLGPGKDGTTPDTGDHSDLLRWFFLFSGSMVMFLGCAWLLKTKKYN